MILCYNKIIDSKVFTINGPDFISSNIGESESKANSLSLLVIIVS